MKTPSEIPKGYVKSTIGVHPIDWQVLSLKEVSDIGSGNTPSTSIPEYWNGNIPWLPTGKVNDRIITSADTFITQKAVSDKSIRLLPKNSIVLAMIGQGQTRGKAALLQISAWVNQNFAYLIPKKQTHAIFLFYLLEHNYARIRYEGSRGGSQGSLNTGMVKSLRFSFPSLLEQQKIAEILSTWDQAISTTQKLIDELKLRNKGLAQQLLTGKKRLKGFDGMWEEQHLEHYFKERKESNHPELPLLSVGEIGVYPQTNSNKKDTSNEDKSKYKRICPGDIGYNTMRMWQGRSALSSLEGIVSPAYTIVTPKKNADAQYFSYLFKLDEVIHKFFRKSQGLVSDTLNCKFKDFKIVKVLTPPSIDEQKAITKVLQKADEELKLYQQQIETLKVQKKGLMQKLLTGEIRVNTKEN